MTILELFQTFFNIFLWYAVGVVVLGFLAGGLYKIFMMKDEKSGKRKRNTKIQW